MKYIPILVLDFGSQYTQLISKRLRKSGFYSEIVPYNQSIEKIKQKYLFPMLIKSIKKAVKEQKLDKILAQLEKIVPDITDQYSTFKIDNEYLKIKTRALHAFQISLVKEVIDKLNEVIINWE